MGKLLRGFTRSALPLLACLALLLVLASPLPAQLAGGSAGWDGWGAETGGQRSLDSLDAASLVAMYAPNLYFKAGENFFPVDCSYHINNSKLYRWDGTSRVLVDSSPNVTSLAGYNENHWLDNDVGDYQDILADYSSKLPTLGYKYYARVVNESSYTCIQYWFFYAYNDHHLNQHEGDWEMIEVILDAGGAPVAAAYSQHFGGQRASWADVEKMDGTHPNVYVAKGSHANYFRPYQGKAGLENDEVGNDGFILPHNHPDLTIELLGETGTGNHPVSQSWLDFEGRWGDWANQLDAWVGCAGPNGPAKGGNSFRWTAPLTWAQSLFLVGSSWFAVSWFVYNLTAIFLAIFLALLAWKIYNAVRTRMSSEVPGLLDILRGRALLGVILGVAAMAMAAGAIFLTWYFVYADIQTVIIASEGNIILIDGLHGVQVNFLVEGTGMTTFLNATIPFYIFITASIVLTAVDIIGLKKASKLGTKYIMSGIIFLVIVSAVLILVSQLNSLVAAIAPLLGGALPPEITAIASAIASSPLQGSFSTNISGLGTVSLTWGLATGGLLLIASAATKIAGGVILKTAGEPSPPPSAPTTSQLPATPSSPSTPHPSAPPE